MSAGKKFISDIFRLWIALHLIGLILGRVARCL